MKNIELKLLLIVLLVSILGLIGWPGSWEILTSFSKNYVPIAPLAAVLFIFTSITYASLYLKNNKLIQFLTYPLLIITIFSALFNLVDFFFISKWSFDHLFFSTLLGEKVYGRMSPLAGLLFVNSSLFFILLKNRSQKLTQFFLKCLFYILFSVSVFFLIGYVENITQFYSHKWLLLSAPTALSFFIISMVQLHINDFNIWPFQYFSRHDVTSRIIRLFLPPILFFLIIIEILHVHFLAHFEKLFSPFILLLSTISFIYFIIVKISKKIGEEIEKANRNLTESEDRYKNVFELSKSSIFVHINGKVVFHNPATGKLFGDQKTTNLVGKMITEFIHPDDKNMVLKRISDLNITGKKSPLIVERLLKIDGTLIYAEVTSTLIKYKNQPAVLTVVNDITERRKNELVSTFYKNISDAVLTSDSLIDILKIIRLELSKIMRTDNFYIAFYNEETGMLKADIEFDEIDKIDEWPAKESLTGYLIDQRTSMLFSKNDILKLNKNHLFNLVGTLPECWLGVPLIENDKPIGALVVQSYDNPTEYTIHHESILQLIANQLSGFIKSKENEKQILESEERLNLFFSQSLDGFFFMMLDNPIDWNENIDQEKTLEYVFKHQRVTKANKAILEQYLATENQFIGITPQDFFAHDIETGKQVWKELFDKGKLHIDTIEKKFDGTDMIIEGDYICLYNSQNQITGHFGIQREVTSLRAAEKELKIAKEKAEESERLKSAFLANMSHEIRTPMNSILGFSDLLMKNNLSEEKKEKYHEIVNSSGKRLMNLISDIIDVSKIDAHQLSMHYTTFNLNNLIDNLHHQFNISPRRKNTLINTVKSLPDKHSFINCDENRLAQVLSNLLENALKFTKDGTVVFGYNLEGNLLHFHVKDSGVGISKIDHQLIFERFGQSDNEILTVKAGSGLGLSISKGIVEILGGTIWVESELNKGATFHFTVPNCLVAKQPAIIEDKDNNNDMETNSTITILIAEDEISNYYYLEAILEKYQFNLIHVENGQEAINAAKLNNIDLILMDFNMPIMNGIDATIEIRKTNTTVPIIALTAYAMSEDRERALIAGCDDYLSKPIPKDMILETINKHLKKDL